MVSQLKNAIQKLRRLRSITKDEYTGEFVKKLMETHEKDICRYRSDETFTVYLVKGLHEYDTHYESLDAIDFVMDTWDVDHLLDDGIPITIELKRMTGRELGRLETYDE